MIKKFCKSVILTKNLDTRYRCSLNDNWPPKQGDTVIILEGL